MGVYTIYKQSLNEYHYYCKVEDGVDYLLFQLLVLGCLTDSYGYVWKKSPYDLYLVESLPILSKTTDKV